MKRIKNGKINNWLTLTGTRINLFINLFFPPRCSFCSGIMDWTKTEKALICQDCLAQISFIDTQGCRYCGKSLEKESDCSCIQHGHRIYYSKAYCACEYTGMLRQKLLDFKFSGHKELASIFGWLIIRKLQMTNENNFDIIISVPMHEENFKKRGYNQSELIARHIAKYYSKPVDVNSLIKTKATLTQSKLDKKDRVRNIKDAFKVVFPKKIKGQKVLLVDDILTTGATVNECSRVLYESGAADVIVATAATGRIINTEPSKGVEEYGT